MLIKYENVKVKIQDKNNESCLLSLISHSNDVGCVTISTCAMEIIKINKEKEEKERLFEEKVAELQQLFINKSLDDLKNLNFIEEYENGDREGIRIDGTGDFKESKGESNPQE